MDEQRLRDIFIYQKEYARHQNKHKDKLDYDAAFYQVTVQALDHMMVMQDQDQASLKWITSLILNEISKELGRRLDRPRRRYRLKPV